jgi:hypothetical protein
MSKKQLNRHSAKSDFAESREGHAMRRISEIMNDLRCVYCLVLLCQILSEHSSLNDSVVIHHTTA